MTHLCEPKRQLRVPKNGTSYGASIYHLRNHGNVSLMIKPLINPLLSKEPKEHSLIATAETYFYSFVASYFHLSLGSSI